MAEMITRTRGSLVKPNAREQIYYPATKTWETWSVPIGYSDSIYNIGELKTITCVKDSRWKRGVFTVHPVYIDTKHGWCSEAEIWPDRGVPIHPDYINVARGRLAAAYNYFTTSAPAWPTSIVEMTNNEALARISEPKVELGVIAFELGETIKMIRSPLAALTKGLHKLGPKLARIRRMKGTDVAEATSGTFLEWIFGWKPTMSDIDTLINIGITRGARTLMNLRSKHGAYESSSESIASAVSGQTVSYQRRRYTKTTVSVHSAQYFKFATVMSEKRNLGYWGLSNQDLLNTLWAITPYSFVFDWVLGVDTWIRAAMPPANVEKLGGTNSVKTTVDTTIVILPPFSYWPTSYNIPCQLKGDSTFRMSRTTLDRRIASTGVGWYPLPTRSYLNLFRASASAALITQSALSFLSHNKAK